MNRVKIKTLIGCVSAVMMALVMCLTVSAEVERQSVHIDKPGISMEIPGDAVYTVYEVDEGQLLNASDENNTYTITLTSEKSDDLFTYKDLTKDEVEQTEQEIQQSAGADKISTYETSQAIFFDCINNEDNCLTSSTVVNGYNYELKLSVGNRELTISDHGIFNTAARSIVFDEILTQPAEVNVLGAIGTVVCVAIAVLVAAILVFLVIKTIKSKHSAKPDDYAETVISEQKDRHSEQKQVRQKRDNNLTKTDSDEYAGVKTAKPVRTTHHHKPKRKDPRGEDAAESYFREIESDGLFDDQSEIPTQVQLDYLKNTPGDENFENRPVRLKVDLIKQADQSDNPEQSDLYELSRNNNEDYDEAFVDDYPEENGFKGKVKGALAKSSKTEKEPAHEHKHASESEKRSRSPRPEKTEKERAAAAKRRAQREERYAARHSSSEDSEFVKNFDSDSYWDKYR